MPLPDPVTLLDALEPVLGPRGSEPQALDGGITNRNYRVVMGGDDYVLRICGKDTAVLGIDRDAECAATMAAAQIGVGPEVVAYRPDLQVLVTRWVEGRPATAEELRASPALEEIAAALRAVHRGPPLDVSFDAFTLVVDYRDEAGPPITANGTSLNGKTFHGDVLGPVALPGSYDLRGPNTIQFGP